MSESHSLKRFYQGFTLNETFEMKSYEVVFSFFFIVIAIILLLLVRSASNIYYPS